MGASWDDRAIASCETGRKSGSKRSLGAKIPGFTGPTRGANARPDLYPQAKVVISETHKKSYTIQAGCRKPKLPKARKSNAGSEIALSSAVSWMLFRARMGLLDGQNPDPINLRDGEADGDGQGDGQSGEGGNQ